jgi:hypothetical protein
VGLVRDEYGEHQYLGGEDKEQRTETVERGSAVYPSICGSRCSALISFFGFACGIVDGPLFNQRVLVDE